MLSLDVCATLWADWPLLTTRELVAEQLELQR
jgi:hypothetical protein